MGWRRCGSGCATWHRCLDSDTVACSHRVLRLSAETVPWVVNPAERCGDCLLVNDQAATARVRGRLAASQASMVAWMDAGIRALEPISACRSGSRSSPEPTAANSVPCAGPTSILIAASSTS
jgi:hypothetical protein